MSGASVRPISTGGTPACLSGTYVAFDAKTYAITVQTSMVPITTEELPDAKLFQDYPLYVTRAKEDGQTRYRLRLGTFESLAKAEALMPALRLTFPAAWANELSPDERRSSSAVKHWRGNTILPRAPARASHDARPSNVTQVRRTIAKPAPPIPGSVRPVAPLEEIVRAPVEELAPPAPTLPRIKRHSLISRPIEQPTKIPRPEVEEIEHEIDLEPPEKPESLIMKGLQRNNTREKAKDRRKKQELIEFEDRRREQELTVEAKDRTLQQELLKQAKDRGLTQELMKTADAGTLLKAGDGICAFALNLGWSQQPLNRENLPGLVIFDKHYLYAVRTVHDGETWYGLRLGFFPTRQRAEQLTYLLSKHFESVLVIPVRSEEFLASAELAVPSLNDEGQGGSEGQATTGDLEQSTEPVALRARPGITQRITEDESETQSESKSRRQSSVSRIVTFALRPLVLLTVLLCVLAGAVLYQILYYT